MLCPPHEACKLPHLYPTCCLPSPPSRPGAPLFGSPVCPSCPVPAQLAVCFIELWPEGRSCKNDQRMGLGIVVGVLVMGWTLWVEGGE